VNLMQLRAPTLDDASAVLAVQSARDIADLGLPDYTLEDLLDEWRHTHDLAADAVVVQSGDEIVGYAFLRRDGAVVTVAPRHEGKGIGARLLEWTERRSRELGREQYRQWVAVGNARAAVLLGDAGYRKVRSYWRMVRPLDRAVEQLGPPADVRLRPLEADRDARAVHALDDLSFSALPDYHPHSFDEFVEEHLRAHDFSPDLSTIAERDGRVIGFTLCRRWDEEAVGYVDVLAVHPEHRRRGLGGTLLLCAFAAFAADGLKEAQLGVASDNPRALALYERVGMHARFQTDVYERPASAD
jgi:mycothiol synthase